MSSKIIKGQQKPAKPHFTPKMVRNGFTTKDTMGGTACYNQTANAYNIIPVGVSCNILQIKSPSFSMTVSPNLSTPTITLSFELNFNGGFGTVDYIMGYEYESIPQGDLIGTLHLSDGRPVQEDPVDTTFYTYRYTIVVSPGISLTSGTLTVNIPASP